HVKMEKMKKAIRIWRNLLIVSLVVLLGTILTQRAWVRAEDLVDIERQIADLQNQMELSVKATTPLESEVTKLNKQIGGIQTQIKQFEASIGELEGSISDRERNIKSQYAVLAVRVRDYYKQSRMFSPLLIFVSSHSAGELTRGLAYKAATADEDKNLIVKITTEIMQLEEDKKKIEVDRVRLSGLQKKLDAQKAFFEKEIAGAKKWQQELSGKIATLTAKQQAILSEKSGTFQTTVGDVPLADDPASRPDYNPGFSPAFAAFSFGAPHFKGMSQYGALGRAKAGQNYEQILKAYYGGGVEIRDHNPDAQITVTGYGSYSLEEYAKRIYEMPGSWGDEGGMEALKAQAIAARSYALARGATICATEACQVFKPNPKGGKWEEAVNATRGKVIYANGNPFSAWYASTSGGYQESYSGNGYTTPGFWDTPSGQSGWTGQAYEKTAGSPWFYKAWYKTRSGDACGRSHPWLNSEEMADILNAWKVLFEGGGDASKVTPESGCWGGSPYSKEELKGIGGFTSVSGASVTYAGNGVTANVTFQTNKGSVMVAGADFKKAFNLRAPGRISLKSGLFNIERK
ncbi:MAG: SpoIID/LytB domain-containing protein, partial [bacterium]